MSDRNVIQRWKLSKLKAYKVQKVLKLIATIVLACNCDIIFIFSLTRNPMAYNYNWFFQNLHKLSKILLLVVIVYQRSVPSFGGHARDVHPQGRISTKNGSEWSKDASCAITIQRQLVTCCGNAPLREMSGLCSEVQSRSAEMKWTTFFSRSKCCSRSWVHRTWRNGQSRPGRYGTPGIVSTLSRYRHTQRIFLTAQWVYWKNIND